MINDLIAILQNKTVLNVTAGSPCGSIFILDIGGNNSISERHSLGVNCAWRIVHGNKVLATWRDNNDPETGNLTLQLKALEKAVIEKVFSSPFLDLTLSFNSGKVLQIIADINQFNPDNEEENYYVADIENNKVFTLNKYYEFETSVYDTEKFS